MKMIVVSALCVLGCCYTVVAGGKNLLMLTDADVDAALVTRVSQYCSVELDRVSVNVLPLETSSKMAWPKLAKVLQGQLGKDDLAAVLLTPIFSGSNAVTVASNMQVAVVNLADPRKEGKAQDELYARWIERETMRAYGLVLGVMTCPNPQCAMSDYKVKPESLKDLGRNYCPYCRKILSDKLNAKGVDLPEIKRFNKGT